jgi:hypothetical protein
MNGRDNIRVGNFFLSIGNIFTFFLKVSVQYPITNTLNYKVMVRKGGWNKDWIEKRK